MLQRANDTFILMEDNGTKKKSRHETQELAQRLMVILASALRLLQPGGRQRGSDERQMFGLL